LLLKTGTEPAHTVTTAAAAITTTSVAAAAAEAIATAVAIAAAAATTTVSVAATGKKILVKYSKCTGTSDDGRSLPRSPQRAA
jgi:hypothetical protein